jgi:hypothetical protein
VSVKGSFPDSTPIPDLGLAGLVADRREAMKRIAGIWIMLAAVGGCTSTPPGLNVGNGPSARAPAIIPGVQGPWGQPVTAMPAGMAANKTSSGVVQAGARGSAAAAVRADYQQVNGQPVNAMVHDHGPVANGGMPPPGVDAGFGVGGMNGMTGVGLPPGVVAGVGFANSGPGRFAAQRTSVRFLRPEGMKVSWNVPSPDGRPTFASAQLDTPGRYNFTQGAIYRLKLTLIPTRPNIAALYPTLEVAPATNKTVAFLAHSSVPVIFTEEDFDQVVAGNYLVKVVYLPDPQFQDVATAGPDEIVSTRLDPGVNPVAEAQRRGSVLLIIRMGNIDLEAPNTPTMETPSPYQPYLAPPAHPMPHAMNSPGKPMMIPQNSPLRSSTTLPGQLPPAPRVLTSSPPANAASQATTNAPDLSPPPATSPSQSAAPATTSQDPPTSTGFDRRPLGLRRRIFSGPSADNQ